MEKVTITYEEHVIDFFNDLILELYKKEHFSYQESAMEYVIKIYDFIDSNLVIFPHKVTPPKLKHKGKNYIFYKANDHTTWYIFLNRWTNNF